ncbi:bifunctional 3-(3-hydroxy-phenyl)propionate/3-hydroxycinnamic acid hydroxylase [Pseudomonas sp. D8002]|uniref:bifunctional 3-(3-hydroxy-phenyl)propionate/3-hydroxycinnamic acid hydroxylase MhpA n=1 Tax=unclassified Pseudomonas TaxID=196821 RepID=UPI0015A17B77|nr:MULTISPECIES: bifunctional 3-(3-hydroxy-phenyl)propionate/3-hydroxycinnamic acid hydroxylase [unclassified Pseudomonas]NWA91409.1 bifunctional 3-(3-hydroxy-phenyl)propionate/3-hydroxycinnamic acid hydroxylase [Pseudomonas sp. D8002]NWB20978.1 bifunctional 3-(3-hydroxy-phenyl)propionate/3-hydroxycinnamic acid hydroxylase [Pseudomonas sp. D4002]
MKHLMTDVILIGYGPVSRVLCALLGEQGHHVTVLERHPYAYPLPRAVCMDHEIHRALHAHYCLANFDSFAAPSPRYQWMNQHWETLIDIDWTVDSISGGPQAYFFHQPSLEKALDSRVRSFSNVSVMLEHEAKTFSQTTDGVSVTAVNTPTGEEMLITGRYLIGADGANSAVRNALGIAWEDRGFQADWLVVDVQLNSGVELDIPAAGQHCNPERPTTFVPGGLVNGRPLRRWEIMRLPHETREQLDDTDYVWGLLNRWVQRDQATLLRHAVYTFRSLVAQQWRDNNIFLVGDAAHTMPPFMGQGMCSGIRDALNLGWRLNMVLQNKASEELLDHYEIERKSHITEVIDASVYLGEIVCVADPIKAAARDKAFVEGTHPPMAPFPHLREGTLGGGNEALLGRLAPHCTVHRGKETGSMDQLVGGGFSLLVREKSILAALSAEHRKFLESINAKVAYLAAANETTDPHAIFDPSDKLPGYFAEHGLDAILVRPDFYIFATAASPDDLGRMVSSLRDVFSPPTVVLQTGCSGLRAAI